MERQCRAVALIPCYNEVAGISTLVRDVSSYVQGVWVVDDGSADETGIRAEGAGARVILNTTNLGKGASLRAGLDAIAAAGFDRVVTLDGDGQHDPAEIPRLLGVNADLVIGNRMAEAKKMSIVRRFVNRWISARISGRIGLSIPDSQCGFRAIRVSAWKNLEFKETRFAFESEMIVAFARANCRIASVPVSCRAAGRASRIHPVIDTVRWFRWWLRS